MLTFSFSAWVCRLHLLWSSSPQAANIQTLLTNNFDQMKVNAFKSILLQSCYTSTTFFLKKAPTNDHQCCYLKIVECVTTRHDLHEAICQLGTFYFVSWKHYFFFYKRAYKVKCAHIFLKSVARKKIPPIFSLDVMFLCTSCRYFWFSSLFVRSFLRLVAAHIQKA